ncbi:MAG TPA: hypothetical protein VKO87_07155, partial [Gemmatimonadaceae bacterium]|nr:hypothetical protein [Gemmatimonadaceae bacterium]
CADSQMEGGAGGTSHQRKGTLGRRPLAVPVTRCPLAVDPIGPKVQDGMRVAGNGYGLRTTVNATKMPQLALEPSVR